MNPTTKRFLIGFVGVLIAGVSTQYPAYAPLLAFIGGKLFGAGASTVHDDGRVSVFGFDFGKSTKE